MVDPKRARSRKRRRQPRALLHTTAPILDPTTLAGAPTPREPQVMRLSGEAVKWSHASGREEDVIRPVRGGESALSQTQDVGEGDGVLGAVPGANRQTHS